MRLLFRILTADVPGELLAAQVAASRRAAEPSSTPWIETQSTYDGIFTTLAVLAENPGVLTADTPGLPAPAMTEGDPQ
jgi:hypothetical protein